MLQFISTTMLKSNKTFWSNKSVSPLIGKEGDVLGLGLRLLIPSETFAITRSIEKNCTNHE